MDQVAQLRDITDVPRGLPTPQLPDLALIASLIVPALSLAFVALNQPSRRAQGPTSSTPRSPGAGSSRRWSVGARPRTTTTSRTCGRHIAPNAQHLFLIVPHVNWNAAGRAREHPFHRVVGRIRSFFGDPRREVDVVSAHAFGYGSAVLFQP
jgi:hypothetical protein